jgi:hypothetical protein
MNVPLSGINPDLDSSRAKFRFACRHQLPNVQPPQSSTWRGGRVVYGSSLENWRGVILTVGSNPTLSATAFSRTLHAWTALSIKE